MLEEKIKNLIIEKYGSVRQFAIKIDIPYTTVDSILKRGIDNSNVGNVIKMCKALNISIDNLLENKDILFNLNFDNAEPIENYSNIVKIPVLGTIKAGVPIEAQEDILEYVDIPQNWTLGGKEFYGLQISGDSMYPKYSENDIVIFEKTEDYTIANKKDCAVMVNGYDATFKNVTINESGITLVPFNLNNQDGYQPTFYNKEQIEKLPVKIVGIAREKRTRL
ncbi:MAG: LexA family protein [Bacilli bacterium]